MEKIVRADLLWTASDSSLANTTFQEMIGMKDNNNLLYKYAREVAAANEMMGTAADAIFHGKTSTSDGYLSFDI